MIAEPLWCIYGLRTMDSPIYRYIGLTTVGIKERFSDHLYTSKRDRTPKAAWIRKHGGNIICEVIEETVEDLVFLFEREQYWIEYHRSRYGKFDSDLPNKCLNLTDGGDGVLGHRHSEESRAKMSRALLGRKFTEDHRRNLSASLRGKNTWTKGNPKWDGTVGHTPEAKERISKATSGRNNAQFGLRGELSPNFGKKPSKETIDKRNATRARSAQDKVTCPHCNKVGVRGGQMLRWHFDNCKHLNTPL